MKKIALILIVTIYISLITTSSSAQIVVTVHVREAQFIPEGIEIQDIHDIIENYPDSILLNLTLYSNYPIFGKDFQVGEYYVEGEEIRAIGFHIIRLNSSTNVTNIRFTVLNPNGDIVCNISIPIFGFYNYHEQWDFTIISLEDQSFIFNMSGLWKYRIEINSDKENLMWKSLGSQTYQTFRPTRGDENELNKLTFYNFYTEGIPVLTTSETLQLSSVRDISRQTEYLKDSASYLNETASSIKDSSEENANYYVWSLIVLVIVASISAASAVIAAYNARLTKNQIETYSREEKESRRALYKPKISAKIHFFSKGHVDIRISNIGMGAAQDVSISGIAIPANEKFSWKTKFMNPGEFQDIDLKHREIEDFFNNYEEIKIKCSFKDLDDNKFPYPINIDTKEIKKIVDNTIVVYQEEILNKIHEQLEMIQKKIK